MICEIWMQDQQLLLIYSFYLFIYFVDKIVDKTKTQIY